MRDWRQGNRIKGKKVKAVAVISEVAPIPEDVFAEVEIPEPETEVFVVPEAKPKKKYTRKKKE